MQISAPSDPVAPFLPPSITVSCSQKGPSFGQSTYRGEKEGEEWRARSNAPKLRLFFSKEVQVLFTCSAIWSGFGKRSPLIICRSRCFQTILWQQNKNRALLSLLLQVPCGPCHLVGGGKMCDLKAHFEQNMAHHALSDDCRTRPDMAIREGFLSACLFCAVDTCEKRLPTRRNT